MIIKCNIKDKNRVFKYIGNDYTSCLYLYLNLKKYGFESDIIDVFIQEENNNISSILLKYYSCLHVYSKENGFDCKEIGDFFQKNGFTILYATKETTRLIHSCFPSGFKQRVSVSTGWVSQILNVDRKSKGLATFANDEDFDQIVRLIYEDEDIGRAYDYNDLAKQLRERNQEGYGRNLVIKRNDLVIAHACTNAELGKISVVAELLVRKDFRRKGYASEIWRDICERLISEGKEVYSIYYSEESRLLHKRIGFFFFFEWAKVVVI